MFYSKYDNSVAFIRMKFRYLCTQALCGHFILFSGEFCRRVGLRRCVCVFANHVFFLISFCLCLLLLLVFLFIHSKSIRKYHIVPRRIREKKKQKQRWMIQVVNEAGAVCIYVHKCKLKRLCTVTINFTPVFLCLLSFISSLTC